MNINYTQDFLDKTALELDAKITAILERNKKIATGQLINSVNTKVTALDKGDNGATINIKIEYLDYGDYVLNGRRSGAKQPPQEAIKKWLMIKKPALRSNKKIKELNSLSFLICRSIARKGIKKLNFLKPVDDLIKDSTFEINLEHEVMKDMTKYIDDNIKKDVK